MLSLSKHWNHPVLSLSKDDLMKKGPFDELRAS